jgi:L-seryl-tRNA(Ser) seleniumtransferase
MLDELHDKVGQRLASLLKSEAAMVTCGAASALTLGTAGVLTGKDPKKVVDLPNLAGMKSEVIIQKSHRFGYEHAVRNCGVTLVEVETADDVHKAVGEKTAMMLFYNNNNPLGQIRDEEFVKLGKAHNVPTFNDAAADVPPVDNFWKYTKMGFDLVAISGGKGIRGPQSSGLLLGRKDLIEAARLNAPPNGNTVGRGMKVNKEEMLGLLVAVERFLKTDHAAERREYDKRAETIRAAAVAVPGSEGGGVRSGDREQRPARPHRWDGATETAAGAVVKAMKDGEPSIGIRSEANALVLGVWMLKPGEDKVVARRLREVLASPAAKQA